MKKLTFIIFFVITIVLVAIFYFIYHISFSEQALFGKANLRKIKEVEIGMDSLNVLKIMGEPLEKRKYKDEVNYDYELPEGISGQITISFDTLGKVIDKGNFLE